MIVLNSGVLRVKKIIKKTSAKVFKDLAVGDEVEFSVQIQRAGVSRGRTYSTYITCRNIATGESISHSFNQLSSIIDKFEFEEVGE